MTIRGNWLNIWDALADDMYSPHKLLGCVLFFVVAARLSYRFTDGAPDDEPMLEPWQKSASSVTHWAIYTLLLIVPLLGWFGVQVYPALDLFELFKLPAIVSPEQHASALVRDLHEILAILLLGFLAMHVGAALFHYLIRKDGVLNRLIPGSPRRDGR